MTQTTSASLQTPAVCVVVQDFLQAWSLIAPTGGGRGLPALDTLVRRGRVANAVRAVQGFPPGDLAVLEALHVKAESAYARGPLEWLGQGGTFEPGSWALGEWLHVEIGSRDARLRSPGPLSPEAAGMLAGALKEQLRFAGIEIRIPPDSSSIYLHAPSGIEGDLVAPVIDAACDLPEWLPKGRDGALLRRLMTEAQMVLHEHPVNVARERAGKRTVNALWLSGLGVMMGPVPPLLEEVYGESAWLKGLCRLHSTVAKPVPATAENVVTGRTPAVVVLSAATAGAQGATLADLERDWFAPLLTAVKGGQIASLALFLDTWRVSIDRADARRFWKRGRSLSEILQ